MEESFFMGCRSTHDVIFFFVGRGGVLKTENGFKNELGYVEGSLSLERSQKMPKAAIPINFNNTAFKSILYKCFLDTVLTDVLSLSFPLQLLNLIMKLKKILSNKGTL